ncbi:MAG: TRAP transporter small permease [Pseudomonadota bacterium]
MPDPDPSPQAGPEAGSAPSALRRIARPVALTTQALNAIGTIVVLVLVALVNGDALSRNLFNAPFQGIVEAVQFSMVLIVFLQLPDVVRVGRLTRSDGFLILLQRNRPRVGDALARAIDVFSAVFMALIAWTIYPEFVETLENGRFIGVPGIFTMPLWPTNLAITVAAVLSTVLFVIKAVAGRRPTGLERAA